MKKIKVNFAIMAMIIGATAAFAFKPASALSLNGKRTNTTWYFTGVEGQVLTASDWSQTSPGDCQPTGSLPCAITVNAGTQSQLQTYLNGHTEAQIDAESTNKRN
jgi:hypothetical protein